MRYLFLAVLISLFYGCGIRQESIKSDLEIPLEFIASNSNESLNISSAWWENFNSSTLNALIKQAEKNNPDILIAYENIEQARLQLGISEADYLPSASISASSGESRTKSDNAAAATSKSTSASLRVNYEIDLWGKIRASNEAAQARFDATKYDKAAITLSMYASVAESYFNFLGLNERLLIASENLNISEKLMSIVEAKYKSGSVSLLDVSRQRSSLLSQKAGLESLELQVSQAKNALAVLAGTFPENFQVSEDAFWRLDLPKVDAGLPSELLLNRPDIARARANVNAANAATKVANAERFPSFSLSASGGVSSAALLSFKDPTSVLSIALNAAYTLFDSGRLKNLRDIEVSRTKVAVQNYNKAILNAFVECEDALSSAAYQNSQEILQKEITDEAFRSLNIASLQYKYGVSDLTTLLDTQGRYFSSKDASAVQRLNHLKSLVSLYKALGGGWSGE
jgi:NodT family efflux transporter outer membrane factor (OMF) lipoprotein